MVRPATPLGPVGLILPTFPQYLQHSWSGVSPIGRTNGTTSTAGSGDGPGDVDPLTELAETCRTAEALGADALWACDHLFWHGPALECMTALTVAATATRRVTLGTCVIQLPLRQAPAVAKQAATLQSLTRGRIVLGVGVGSHAGEYEQSGIDYPLAAASSTPGSPSSGARGRPAPASTPGNTGSGVDRYRQLPAPQSVPVWVGGSSEAALRRAAAWPTGGCPCSWPQTSTAPPWPDWPRRSNGPVVQTTR